MPPELKMVIRSIEEMTCENCVCSYKPEDLTCCNPNSDNWYRNRHEFCSEGMWLCKDHGNDRLYNYPDSYLFIINNKEL